MALICGTPKIRFEVLFNLQSALQNMSNRFRGDPKLRSMDVTELVFWIGAVVGFEPRVLLVHGLRQPLEGKRARSVPRPGTIYTIDVSIAVMPQYLKDAAGSRGFAASRKMTWGFGQGRLFGGFHLKLVSP